LKEKLASRLEKFGERARLLGWTNQMPRLMLSHHLVVTKAGGATVQEAIAGRCPMILNQVIPGQEDGNAELVRQLDAGAVAEKSRDVVEWVGKAFANDGELWKKWRGNLAKVARPDASIRIAELALNE
jgi:UDP-N-acetylglucosamine:LPS N-acetylglucosamine transferase